jgi:hypothetical protein
LPLGGVWNSLYEYYRLFPNVRTRAACTHPHISRLPIVGLVFTFPALWTSLTRLIANLFLDKIVIIQVWAVSTLVPDPELILAFETIPFSHKAVLSTP